MKTAFVIIGVALLIFIIKACTSSGKKKVKAQTPDNKKNIPLVERPNDKLIVVNGISYEELKSAIKDCCKMYNGKENAVLPRVYNISDKEFAITFPYDIDFEIYCYFINYLKYPIDITYDATVVAWTTTKPTDNWITERSANKNVMLFIPADDNEHDNVFLTTSDNIGYKLGFAVGEQKQLLVTPKKVYESAAIELTGLKEKESEDFQ